jgi:protein-tyrosine phosphatase
MSHEIIDNLFLGDAGSCDERPDFFKLIVNCCPEINYQYTSTEEPNVVRLKFYDDKDDNPKLIQILKTTKILEQIHHFIKNKQPVIIHCAMGIQRSASIVACYLLKYFNRNIKTVVSFIKSKRPVCFSTGYNFLETMVYIVKSEDVSDLIQIR